jgi:hypothetical protein
MLFPKRCVTAENQRCAGGLFGQKTRRAPASNRTTAPTKFARNNARRRNLLRRYRRYRQDNP